MSLPPFITRTRSKKIRSSRIDSALTEYRPLVGSWLIRMALLLNWHEPGKGERWPAILGDDDFLAVIGMDEDDLPLNSRRTAPSTALCRKILETRLLQLESMELSPDSPLFVNLGHIARLLNLGEAEQSLLLFAALFDLFPTFRDAVCSRCEKSSDQHLIRILNGLTSIGEAQFQSAISSDGLLAAAGLIRIDHRTIDLEGKIDMIRGLSAVLLMPHATTEELAANFVSKAGTPTLSLANFPHLAADSAALLAYLKNAVEQRARGSISC